jgi:hypothetical protein
MNTLRTVLVGLWLAASPLTFAAAEEVASAASLQSVQRWLALADAGDGAGSWKQAAPYFQEKVSSAAWQQALAAVRNPLGAVLTRLLSSASVMNAPAGAPEGQYVVAQFATAFQNKAAAVETITVARQGDGSWRVVGYFIR